MRKVILSAAVAACALLMGAAPPSGMYARHAQPIWNGMGAADGHSRVLVSPDRASRVVARYREDAEEGRVDLTVSGRIGIGRVALGPGVGSELLWAPDGRAFAVSTSDGGANGLFRVIVVAAAARGLQVTDLTSVVHRRFGHPVRCAWPEPPNVGAVQWVDGSDKLVVAAEIVAHSNCDSFGTFRAYVIDRRRRAIVESIDQITAKRRFGPALGDELRAADDTCIRLPRRCWVATNHPEIPRPSAR